MSKPCSDSKKFNNLIKRIASDDKNALEDFYAVYGKLIYAASLTVVPLCLADEVVDDVLAKIWLTAKDIKNIKKPVSWLYTVTVNNAKDKLRSEKEAGEIFETGASDKNIEEVESCDSFYYYIKNLDSEEQLIMVLRFIEDMTFKEIAKEVNKPLNTVTSVYYRSLKKIKENLQKDAKK